MKIHKGRLIDHLHLQASDLARSRAFYGACLGVFGLTIDQDEDGYFTVDELFVQQRDEGTPPSRIHFAFQASSKEQVDAFHRAALGAGGTENGGPGFRQYHPRYYAAYVYDPDGNNIEAVFHGLAKRSARSVEISVKGV
ncbi:MAG: VOC family protein [Shimia sp.]